MGIKEPTTTEQKQKEEERAEMYKIVKGRLLVLFNDKNQEEIDSLYREIRIYASIAELDPELVIEGMKKGFTLENPEEFVNTTFELLKKLTDKKIEQPELFEMARRKSMIQGEGNTRLSKLGYYRFDDVKEGVISIHIAPKGNLEFVEVIKSFREGFKELVKKVEEDKRIKEIQAISWIVASNPELLKQLGFVIDGPTDDKDLNSGEKPVWKAHVSREALLEKHSKFKKRNI